MVMSSCVLVAVHIVQYQPVDTEMLRLKSILGFSRLR